MRKATVAIIVAVAENGVIGYQGKLPWSLPADLARFKRLTVGEGAGERNAVIMGRSTWESIPEHVRPLPKRANIVVSTTMDPRSPKHRAITVARSLTEALRTADGFACAHAYVIGGVRLFREALMLAERIELTVVHDDAIGDTHLPELLELPNERWRLVDDVLHASDEQHAAAYSFRTYLAQKR